jgi:hypothetical protein
VDWLTVDKILVRKFRFRPWELEALTVPETFSLYLQAVIDEAEASRPQDDSLTPHLADEKRADLETAFAHAAAFNSLTPEQMLTVAERMYPE